MSWIRTFTGKKFFPLDPDPEGICVEDLAHALALTCRFNGHVKEFYSVAQHSCLVASLCSPENALWGLLHDAPEAYVSDLVRPVKDHPVMHEFRNLENVLMIAVCQRFGLPLGMPEEVRKADDLMLFTEARDLMGPGDPETCWWKDGPFAEGVTVKGWSWQVAEETFLRAFAKLTGGKR